MNFLELNAKQKGFFNLVKKGIQEEAIFDADNNGLYIRGDALRFLKQEAKANTGWACITPFALFVEIQDRSQARNLAAFFSGEGWVEERQKWNGITTVFVLDLHPGVIAE